MIDRQIILAVAAAFCWIVQGTSQANFSSSATLPSFNVQFPRMATLNVSAAQKADNSNIEGTIVAIYEIGCAIGALSCYFLGDLLGRRRMIMLAGTVVIIGSIIECSSFQLGQLIPGRIIKGLGVGAFTATVPMWVSESVAPKRRGPLVLLCGGFGILGIAIMSWINVGLFIHVPHSSVSWRLPLAIPIGYTILVLIFAYLLPESPRWLVSKGRNQEAFETLKYLRNGDDPSDEFDEILLAHQNELAAKDVSPFALNEHKELQRTILAVVLSALAQMSGINTATFYETQILEQSGFNALTSRIFTAGMQTWQAIMAMSAVWWVARFNRRTLMFSCAIIIGCAMACKCGLLSDLKNRKMANASIAFDFVIMGSFPVGLFVLPFLYAAEISGLEVRGKVTAMAGCANWLFNYVLAQATPTAMDNIGYKYFGVYVATNFVNALFIYFFLPETKGRTLEEMDQIFVNSRTPFDTVACGANIVSGPHIAPEALDDDGKPVVGYIEDVEKASAQHISNSTDV